MRQTSTHSSHFPLDSACTPLLVKMSLSTQLMISACAAVLVVLSFIAAPTLAAPRARLSDSVRAAHTIPPEILALAAQHGKPAATTAKKPPAPVTGASVKEPAATTAERPPAPVAGASVQEKTKPEMVKQPANKAPPAALADIAQNEKDRTSKVVSVPVSGAGVTDSTRTQKMMNAEMQRLKMQKAQMEAEEAKMMKLKVGMASEKSKMQKIKKGMEAEKKKMQKLTMDMKKSKKKLQTIAKMKKAASVVTRKFLPRACNCKRGTARNGVCYDFVRGHASYCKRRKCAPRYQCVAVRTGIKCILRRTTKRVVPVGPGRCASRKVYGYMYVPYSTY